MTATESRSRAESHCMLKLALAASVLSPAAGGGSHAVEFDINEVYRRVSTNAKPMSAPQKGDSRSLEYPGDEAATVFTNPLEVQVQGAGWQGDVTQDLTRTPTTITFSSNAEIQFTNPAAYSSGSSVSKFAVRFGLTDDAPVRLAGEVLGPAFDSDVSQDEVAYAWLYDAAAQGAAALEDALDPIDDDALAILLFNGMPGGDVVINLRAGEYIFAGLISAGLSGVGSIRSAADVTLSVVPEPASVLLMTVGGLALALRRRSLHAAAA